MNPIILDKVRGCMLGGAVGDALGYPVMNLNIDDIRKEHGENGISEYLLDENKWFNIKTTVLNEWKSKLEEYNKQNNL